jgi:succinate dehydrogenase/fumarate reductase flavoprotein subunit
VQGIPVTKRCAAKVAPQEQSHERFMEKVDPKRMGFHARRVVARAIYTEVKEGRVPPRRAYLDISHQPAGYVKKKP